MARVRTVDFLPEIFQTSTNRQFLGATLDQLVQEPKFKKIQGFAGRRVGPGVNPNDRYVTETSKSRADYQLEPGVILKDSDNVDRINNAITYPGIIDALALQGGNVEKADRLFTSEYYSWDPFVDFDKFVNFSQYYWLPGGPDSVDVFSDSVPITDDFTVTRANGVYTFSGVPGNNPTITLVRGGNYTFQVAQNQKETVNFRVTNQSTSAYVIDYQNNPTLTLVRGNTYIFNLVLRGDYPFYIKTQPTLGTNNQYTDGVDRNGAVEGLITFTVPQDAPDTLYYTNNVQPNMRGQINVIDATPGTGPGFWIQAAPGVDGKLPSTPNISSRDVLGVINNGEDLGTVTFNVPLSTAQNFYYGLESVPNVDLVAGNLKFSEINNQSVESFLEQYQGIDGIANLNGKTIIFTNTINNAQDGGWQISSQFDPLTASPTNNGLPGSFDSTLFDQTVDIPESDRYGVWQIQYVTTDTGYTYIKLNFLRSVEKLQKFNILSGTTYASTSWYKNAEGYFEQIPLLTAILDTLYYQDGTDPGIFGRFKLINQDQVNTLDIAEILGRKNYTSPNGVVFTNGLKVRFIGSVEPAEYQNNEYYVEGVGTAIKLIPVSDFVTPETYVTNVSSPYDSTAYDIGLYDAGLNEPLTPDYLTINRASPDLNPWSRTNRWFHIDVIQATATYNNTVATLDNNFRGKRPIIEFRAGTHLYNFGTEAKQPVNIIDFSATDALSNINGQVGYNVDGFSFSSGARVIFAADRDPQVRNKIYVVEFITPDSEPPLIAQPIINLVPADDADVLINQSVVCLSGITQQGKSFYFDGVDWILAQQKTGVNQAPLFDVYDLDGVSFGDRIKYPSTNFTGSKLFSYAPGPGSADPVLGFALKYLSLTNVGDIVFDNNLYTDQFTYTKDSVSSTEFISQGIVRQYSDRVNFITEIGWQTAAVPSITRQQFRFSYDGSPLKLDVKANLDLDIPGVVVFVGSEFQDPGTYLVETTADSTTITLQNIYLVGDIIEVQVISDQTSKVAFYEVPVNLENNPFNENSNTFTLGTIRNHYESIAQNLKQLSGPINGANNTRDLGNIVPYGQIILQQSSPLTMAGYFMRSNEYNLFSALEYNSREYEKFKAQLLDSVIRNDYTNLTVPQMLTAAIADINTGRTQINPFYWSDMLPASNIYKELVITYTVISTPVFDLTTTYDFSSSNYKGLLVYVNDELLTIGYDYTVAQDEPRLTITVALTPGDVIRIQEYDSTVGNFVPNTPTKMGLYPAFKPEIYLDKTYVNPTLVIQGHDGSKTIAFGDFRDQLLLEFETRIYNNLKVKSEIPLTAADVIPGQFRVTDYSLSEVNEILAQDFLSWIGWNKLNYTQQDFITNNEFTWNYSSSGNKLTGTNNVNELPLPAGAWRGIYRYFYDTDYPNTRPWEMLGFSQQPDWWIDVYGPVEPNGYTSDNLVLWDDLAQGRVADPAGEYFLPQYARPRLTEVIPSNSEGNLVSPFESVVGTYDPSQFQKSWAFGDGGPVEATWFKSSSYPFAIMRLLALTRPAEFFSLFADRDLYKYDSVLGQYLYNNRYRLDANGVQVYGNGTSKASFINWIIDYNQQLGRNSATALETDLANLDVRLCYRMGTFTDKQYLKIYTEKSSPNSLNSSLLLPDESYNLLIYKNQPFERIVYSSVVIQNVEDGYAVYGYSITQPYFEILASRPAGTKISIEAGGSAVRVPNEYTNNVVQVPYGYVFSNRTTVVDFLLSYGALLESQGLVFDQRENGRNLNWPQMAQEFLYWANQGWSPGSVISLNPAATSLTAVKPQAIVDSVVAQTPENLILDQNRTTMPVRDLVIDRFENTFKISSLTQTIAYLDLRFTSYESMIVLDNVSIFNDLIYDPITGARQSRINVSAAVSADWNGQLDAQGFILNDTATVREWQPNRKYAKGEIVLYKNNYWSAQTIVQPSVEFDYSKWVKSDYTKIQRGLLQNIPNKANQLANSYNVNEANLEGDQDLLSYGLIGFRPRNYMSALNLDDVSQVNVYKQFLKDKGSIRSVRLLGNANLGKEVAEYDVFENWAIQRAVYGANANRSFVEFRLNEALLDSDPSVVQVIEPQQSSQADQTIEVQNIWRQSYKITSPDIFPTTLTTPNDVGLPSAGYVNLDDVDITVFSLLGDLTLEPGVLETIGVGTTVWAAKSNTYNWDVYRCSGVPGNIRSVTSNLDNTCTVTFSGAHGLTTSDVIVIRYFNELVDGVYRVLATPTANTIVIELTLPNTLNGTGVAYFLQTMRVSQASDAVNLPYVTDLVPGARIWVDNNGNGQWTVIEKQQPFSSESIIEPDNPQIDSLYGSSIAQGSRNLIALVGSPAFGSTGAVYSYVKNLNNEYVLAVQLLLESTGTQGFGNSVDIGTQNWMVAGASKSNSDQGYAVVIYRPTSTNAFSLYQFLYAADAVSSTGKFGYSTVISQDENWIYVGAPEDNKVYAYGRVDIEEQFVRYKTDGSTFVFGYNQNIQIDQTSQLIVTLDSRVLTPGVDYSANAVSVTLFVTPPEGQTVTISRRVGANLGQFFEVEQTSTSGTGTGALFTVDITDQVSGIYTVTIDAGGSNYAPGDTITILGSQVGGATPANDLTVTVSSVSSGAVTGISVAGTPATVFRFGQLLYTATDYNSFSLRVNGTLQRPGQDYTIAAGTPLGIQFASPLSAGSLVEVLAESYYKLVEVIDGTALFGLGVNDQFGFSLSTSTDGRQIIIGTPELDIVDGITTYNGAGKVYAFDRGVIRYVIDDTAQLQYSIPTGSTSPVSVLLNGTRLKNSQQYVGGQFSVDLLGETVTLENVTLQVGDILEIEVNTFNLIQDITANQLSTLAQFGSALDLCPNNCSLYVGSPGDSTIRPEAGSVDRRVNQARVYGTITSANTTTFSINAGEGIRINNIPVDFPTPDAWQSNTAYTQGSVVEYASNFYVAVRNVPNTSIAITDTSYWIQGSWVDQVVACINDANITNVIATKTPVYSGNSIGYYKLTISVINVEAADEFNRLNVLPGFNGTAFTDIGFDLYAYTQTITSPNPVAGAAFGSSLNVDTEADNLVVGAPRGNIYEPTTFDNSTTYFDDRSTIFSKTVIQSGAVYTFDYLPSANSTISNPGKFVFGQQIYDTHIQAQDKWGTALSYVGSKLLIGSPGSDLNDSSITNLNYGRVAVFNNPTQRPAWTVIRQQKPVVDVYLLNSVFMYDQLQSNKTTFFDFFNPLQGKILGAARQNIDYIGAVDPAKYNVGPTNNNGNFWANNKVGEIWWNTDSVRFIDPNQDDITYASRRWGQVFPGSQVEVYQWTESTVPPAQYAGPGVPNNLTSYTVISRLTVQGTFETLYYFWVTGLDIVATTAGKTLSTNGISSYIENPRGSGIPYIAALDASTVAIYNGLDYISAADTILHVEFDQTYNTDNIHTEFELIAQDKADSFLSNNLYRKLQDSFCGVNTTGAKVPDPALSPAEQYGVQFRPRQSMFVDRFEALKNYLTRANNVLKNFPISETRKFTLLNSQEPEPTASSGEWNKRVANIEELSYQDLNEVPNGYKYLVVTDSTNNGLWTIYTVATVGTRKVTQLTRVQTYDTRKYWNYINWYQPGYNPATIPGIEVPVYSALDTLQLPAGSIVKVTANAQGKWEIYLRTDTTWSRVGLQDGTIEFSETLWNYQAGRFGFDVEVFDAQYFDQEPTTETRKIIQAINEELFVDDLLIERNRSLILMFNYILSEFQAPEWLTKTSLIDVKHNIRELVPYQVYRQDNQEFVLDYIQEVKPYHVQIREFNLTYNGSDSYNGSLTDFDLPAYWNTELLVPQFTSPILLPYTQSTAVGTGTPNYNSDAESDAEIWSQLPWSQWYNNYLLSIQSVVVIDGGAGYTEPPEVVITGTSIEPAEMTAIINNVGQVIGIEIVNPGQGYSTTAVITLVGGNGTGAKAYAVMGNDLVRNIKTTVKYDRFQYNSDVTDWQANIFYNNGDLVRYIDNIWSANSQDSTGVISAVFNPEEWTLVNPGVLSIQYVDGPLGKYYEVVPGTPYITGVDRTYGIYAPGPNEPGRDLPLIIDGIDYPGVQVFGPNFNQNTGFDVGNYDINPFDNISFGPEGRPTYDPAILDAIYESSFLDPYLGTRATDVNVDGGAFVDTYSSHAPEELVPGAEFDTLDLRVYTRPGSDWQFNGHGFAEAYIKEYFVSSQTPISFENSLPYPTGLVVYNQTTGNQLVLNIDYSVNWVNQTVTVISGASVDDIISIDVYGLGGGNQLYRTAYTGNDIIDNTVTLPVNGDTAQGGVPIQELAVFVNGQPITDFDYSLVGKEIQVTFDNAYTANDYVSITVLGPTTLQDGSTQANYSWSTPVSQTIIADGVSTSFNLDNNLNFDNPLNAVVTVNGIRARTAGGVQYVADGSSAYALPTRLGFSQELIADNEVLVYLNDEVQQLNVDYTVEPWDGVSREVIFAVEPPVGTRVVIGVRTNAQCYINPADQTLIFNIDQGLTPLLGDVIVVTTWNDTRQQSMLTQVIVGPVTTGATVTEGYDETDFDQASVSFTPGSFDYAAGSIVTVNDLIVDQPVGNGNRLWVTLNGRRLSNGVDFDLVNNEIVLPNILGPADVVMIMSVTGSVVPDAMAFRIFQDMRGVQATYRITEATTTTLTQALGETDDVIYVDDTSALGQPDVNINIWGVLTINGERIMYREIDYVNNTVSSLLRGTAGTAIAAHAVGSFVYDMGRGNLMPEFLQNYIVSDGQLANGTQTVFVATDITVDYNDSSLAVESIEVYVGGTRVTTGYTLTAIAPVEVEFDVAPADGSEVTILVRRGVTWYAPGPGTPSNGIALQDTNTQSARFLRGLQI